MSEIIQMFLDLVLRPIGDALYNHANISIYAIDISIGFYEPWFTITLYDLLAIGLALFIMFTIVKITWNIFKGIYRRIKL